MAALGGAQKAAARGAPAYSRFINRRLGRRLAALAAVAGLSPNAVTAISAAFSAAGIAVLALVPWGTVQGVGVSALLLIGYAFDSADGQLARLRGGGSPAGEWIDHVVDATKVSALPLGLFIGLERSGDVPPGWLAVPLVFTVVSAVLFFTMILTEQLRRAHGVVPLAATGGGPRSWVRSVIVLPTDYGVQCLMYVLLGVLPVFLVVYGAIVAATTVFLVMGCVKWYRELRSLTSAPRAKATASSYSPG